MSYNSPSSLLSHFLLFTILLAMTQVPIAAREIPKQPENFIGKDGSVLIPGIGRFVVPSFGGGSSYNTPYSGGGGVPIVGSGGGDEVPSVGSGGGDEVPSVGSGGGDEVPSVGFGGGDEVPSVGSGGGDEVPSVGSGTGGNGDYIPGLDDTFVPNPGVEIPNP